MAAVVLRVLFRFLFGLSLLPGASVAPETRQDPLRASASDTSRATLAAILWCKFCDSIVYVAIVTITFQLLFSTITPHVCQDDALFHELVFVHGPSSATNKPPCLCLCLPAYLF